MKKIVEKLNIGQRLNMLIGLAIVMSLLLTGMAINGLLESKASLKTVYDDRMVPTKDLNNILENLLDNELAIEVALSSAEVAIVDKNPSMALKRKAVTKALSQIEENLAENEILWKAYMATYLTPEEVVLAKNFEVNNANFIQDNFKQVIEALKSEDFYKTRDLARVADAHFAAVKHDMSALLQLQQDVAKQEFLAAESRYKRTLYSALVILAASISFLLWLGFSLVQSITKRLKQAIAIFGEVEKGQFDTPLEVKGDDELSQVLAALKKMRTRLGDDIQQQQVLAKQVQDQAALFQAQLDAISTSTGMIETDLEGTILKANDLFLNSLGYSAEELIGKNRSVLLDSKDVNAAQNTEIIEKFKRGESYAGQIKRIAKNGKEVWLEATYNPIMVTDGGVTKVLKVVNYYRDITHQKIKDLDFSGQLTAIGRSQGVIELDLEGYVLKVNQTYLDMLGYQEQDLLDQHVSKLLDPTFANSAAYKDLWNKLKNGETDAGQYKRIGKNGKEVWIQASYNPIKDDAGNIIKIVNYTIDITAEKIAASDNTSQIAAINKVQGVIEFDLTGKILSVNDNFAAVTGYSKAEIVGNHHSMFADAAYKASAEYKRFWEDLASGIANDGQFRRIGKGGTEVWLQATYNPILDLNGKPYKVVKFATDITAQYNAARTLENAVEETQGIIEGAKAGDLSSRVSLEGKTGAIASLCDGVNALMDKMTEVITQVREAGETINTAANEIATGNNDLSSRTEQQASSLEETASSMEELASTVKQNAENAKQANQLAAAASGVAVKGGEVVGQVVNTMSAINSSAKKIEDIISVIDGIAFQTNILALNAAVEAARAGEQGRGFAVVAGEVRNLAQRSASAAKEIKELISDSVSKTAEGTTQVEQAGKTMQEIVASVQRVTDIMGEISAASSEQSTGIDQVNNAITSMDEVTQQNAALVEEAAAAAESLVEQATSLMDTVGAFRLAGQSNRQGNRQQASYQARPSNTKALSSNERRASSSAMRSPAKPAAKPASKPASQPVNQSSPKISAKTGTDDGAWEEF